MKRKFPNGTVGGSGEELQGWAWPEGRRHSKQKEKSGQEIQDGTERKVKRLQGVVRKGGGNYTSHRPN